MSYIDTSITKEDFKKLTEKIVSYYDGKFASDTSIDFSILDEIFQKIHHHKQKAFASHSRPEGYEINQFKFAGILCFWIRKLKPFAPLKNHEAETYVNEYLSLYIPIAYLYHYQKLHGDSPPKLSARFINDFVRSLRYNSHSPNSTAFIFESLCL